MSTCDLCSQPAGADAIRLTPAEVRTAVRNGLRPPAPASGLGAAFGLSSEEIDRGWIEMAMADTTDWVLCPSCATASARFRPAIPHAPAASATRAQGQSTPAPFADARAELERVRMRAFETPGPLFSAERRAVMEAWFAGVARNLEDAGRGAASGTDIQGNPMSRAQLAGAVLAMCTEYGKALPRVGEVCGPSVRDAVERMLATVRSEAEGLTRPAGPSPSAVTPATSATTDPAKLAEALAALARALAVQSVIPQAAVPVMAAIERWVGRWREILGVIGIVAVVAAFVIGFGIGGRTQSFWLGAAAFAGAIVVLFVVVELLDRAFLGAVIGRVSGSHGIDGKDGIALFKQLRVESNLIRRIVDQAKGLSGKTLSSDLSNRVVEAALLALLQTSMQTVLEPSRDISAKKEKWRPVKELADTSKSTYTPVAVKCRAIVLAVQQVLENREKLFETLDRISARLARPAVV